MRVIVSNDHSLCVSKFIWLYYRNSHLMSIEHLHETCIPMFENIYKFFFHWSWQVRNLFYYFILFIINHRIKYMKFEKTKENIQILRRGSAQTEREKNSDLYTENVKNNF